ncbi:energy-coupling factor ABC transporter ATP-binding protein [Halocatena marina]|uniref:energy-coupling factor ABC transporter ATP-binding protein n=1 Tax=Halocatena marina TaxID=2934937 RepID=UPI00200F2D7C|nr:ABC transporter ATP-binding protein [Halocatena marina]
MTKTVEITNLNWRYLHADDNALEDITLEVGEGEVLGIVGANENGKTTLLKSISGMIPKSTDGIKEGEVRLYGTLVEEMNERELAATVGFVFSDPELQFTMMNVLDEIVFGLENLRLDLDEIDRRLFAAAEKVGIEDLLDKSPLELSGGQKQRVALASVIAMKPDIFVFDEPTNMLDPHGKAQVFEIISELIAEDKTVIIAEHDIEHLAPLADRLIYIDDGKITHRAPPHQFFEELSDAELASLFAPEVTLFARQLQSSPKSEVEIPLTIDEAVSLCEKRMKKEEQL